MIRRLALGSWPALAVLVATHAYVPLAYLGADRMTQRVAFLIGMWLVVLLLLPRDWAILTASTAILVGFFAALAGETLYWRVAAGVLQATMVASLLERWSSEKDSVVRQCLGVVAWTSAIVFVAVFISVNFLLDDPGGRDPSVVSRVFHPLAAILAPLVLITWLGVVWERCLMSSRWYARSS